jgi:hypothetical protein
MAEKTKRQPKTELRLAPASTGTKPNLSSHTEAPTSAFSLFNPCARAVMDNLMAFLWLGGLVIVAAGIASYMHPAVAGRSLFYGGAWPALYLVGLLIAALVAPGQLMLQLKSVRKQPIATADAFTEGLRYFWRLVGLGIVLTFVLGISLLLLIVPFFLVLPRLVLAPYFLIDRNMGIFDAVRASNDAYKRHRGIWGVLGVSLLLSLPTILPFVGVIVTSVLRFLYQPVFAMRYEQFKLLDEGKPPQTPVEAETAVV